MLNFEKIFFKSQDDFEKRILIPITIIMEKAEEKLKFLQQREEIKENFARAKEKVRQNLNKPHKETLKPAPVSAKTLSASDSSKDISYINGEKQTSYKLILLFLSLLQKNN